MILIASGPNYSDSAWDEIYSNKEVTIEYQYEIGYSSQIDLSKGEAVDSCYFMNYTVQESLQCVIDWDNYNWVTGEYYNDNHIEIIEYYELPLEMSIENCTLDSQNNSFEISFNRSLPEGVEMSSYISGMIRESSQQLDENNSLQINVNITDMYDPYIIISFDGEHRDHVHINFNNNNTEVSSCGFGSPNIGIQVIGEYTLANNTLWFQPRDGDIGDIVVRVDITDVDKMEELEGGGDFVLFEMEICLLPLIFIASIITAFVKKMNALGVGLLCSIPLTSISSFIFSIMMYF